MPETRVIPVARPWMGEPEAAAAARAIRSGWVTQGPEVEAFEREFAALVGAEHACAVSSCTAALHLALLVIGVEPGDEVVTVSHSFVATSNAILHAGGRPVFVDVEPGTFNMDPRRLEGAITPRTRAVLCVHQLGMPCDMAEILEVAGRRSLPVIEDAACALGSSLLWERRWEAIGRPHGALACFSFHPRKLVSTGEGGMVTTSDAGWDARLRLLRQQGMSVADRTRHDADDVVFESYPVAGYNYRMTDIQAAVGREQLKRLPEMVRVRREHAERYRVLLADIPGLGLPEEPAWARSNWQSFCVRLPAGIDQRLVMRSLLRAGVATRRGVMCAHREAPHRAVAREASLHESEAAQDRCVILPLFHEMTPKDQEVVARCLQRALATAS